MIPRDAQTQDELDRLETTSYRTIDGTRLTREPRALVIENEHGKVRIPSADFHRLLNWYERDQSQPSEDSHD